MEDAVNAIYRKPEETEKPERGKSQKTRAESQPVQDPAGIPEGQRGKE